MYRISNGNNPEGGNLTDFSLWEVKGRWISREGLPDVRIYRNKKCKNGCYHLEMTYRTGDTFRRPIKKLWGNIRYFDLYGFVGLAYDPNRDVLQLSAYGNYYRAEDEPQG